MYHRARASATGSRGTKRADGEDHTRAGEWGLVYADNRWAVRVISIVMSHLKNLIKSYPYQGKWILKNLMDWEWERNQAGKLFFAQALSGKQCRESTGGTLEEKETGLGQKMDGQGLTFGETGQIVRVAT